MDKDINNILKRIDNIEKLDEKHKKLNELLNKMTNNSSFVERNRMELAELRKKLDVKEQTLPKN